MSERLKRAGPPVLVCLWLGLLGGQGVSAQNLRAHIQVLSSDPAKVRVELELPAPVDSLSFRNTYAGVIGLGERIANLEASDSNRAVAIRKLAPGEYQAAEVFTRVRYEAVINERLQPSEMSHVSWLGVNQGLLMLADLLPQRFSKVATAIGIDLPTGWSVTSNARREETEFRTTDPDKVVFLVGATLREKTRRVGTSDVTFATGSKWPFSDDDALKSAEKLIKEYSELTGHRLTSNSTIMLIPFPGDVGPERWSAETRGNLVVLMLGRHANRKAVYGKLGIVLSHEIFHLWVPNALALDGDYDWFFEGFTLYQALLTDLRLGLISFKTYLDTLSRVYSAYLSSPTTSQTLPEASQRRWTTGSSVVYNQGMLVAFIYDLKLRKATDCGVSLGHIYRRLFELRGAGQKSANETIIKILNEPLGMEKFSSVYVESPTRLNLELELAHFGIELRRETSSSGPIKLGVTKDLNQSQRKFLRCLGYRD